MVMATSDYQTLYSIITAAYTAALLMTVLVLLVFHVFGALGLFALARRRGLSNPGLAWVPVANCWLLGLLADQYAEHILGKRQGRRTLLTVFGAVGGVLYGALASLLLGKLVPVAFEFIRNDLQGLVSLSQASADPAEEILHYLLSRLSDPLLETLVPLVSVAVLMVPVMITWLVLYHMSLYQVYRSCRPNSAVLFTVLGILFNFLPPCFLFACRNEDQGMARPQPTQYNSNNPQ